MADCQLPSRGFVREFLRLYRSLPALWQFSSRDYKDRSLKAAAYDRMVAKLREVLPSATADCVRRRINILRTNFRKEMKKCVEAERRGMRYTPKLWYYSELLFLRDHGALRDMHEIRPEERPPQVRCVDQKVLLGDTTCEYGQSTEPAADCRPCPAKIKREVVTEEELGPLKSGPPISPCTVVEDYDGDVSDDEDILARHMAAKLRRLDPLQKIFAEKLIHDVLFEGQLGLLTRNARVVINTRE